MKKAIKILAGIIGIFLIMMLFMFLKMGSEMKNLTYYEVDLKNIEDGVFKGKSETTLVKAEIEIQVQNHEIIRIDILKHDNGLGEKAERILNDMIDKNTYEVDAISGATSSSEVLKSAVSDALANGQDN